MNIEKIKTNDDLPALLEPKEFQQVFSVVRREFAGSESLLDAFEQAIEEGQEADADYYAVSCLKTFYRALAILEEQILNPVDFKKIFQTERFGELFAEEVQRIKKLGLISRVEKLNDQKEIGSEQYGHVDLDTLKNALLRADFYQGNN